MYDFDNTSASALLHAYLEGDLDPFHEPRLFGMLAESPELRSEMHDCLLIGNVVEADSDRLQPGAHLRQNVWNTLGLSAPAGTLASPAFWNPRIIWVALASALIAVLLTLGSIRLLDRVATNTPTPAMQAAATTHGHDANAPAPVEPAPVATPPAAVARPRSNNSVADGWRLRTHAIGPHGAGAERPAPTLADRIADDFQAAHSIAAVAPRGIAPDAHELPAYQPATAARLENRVTMKTGTDNDDDGDPERRLFVEAHGLTATAYPTVAIGRPSNPPLNNLSAGVGYALSAESRIAAEMGEEPFPQRYRGVENGRGVTYTQQPILLWGGISWRYEMEPAGLPGNIHPYAKLFAGGTGVGPLFKSTLGFTYLPDTRVGFALGIEGSILPYRFQGNWFSVRKLGVVYGISLLL